MSKKALGKRSKAAPKPELEELIKLVNLIPPTMELKSLKALVGESEGYVGPKPGTPKALERQIRLRTAFTNYMLSLPPLFVEEIYKDSHHEDVLEISEEAFDTYLGMAIENYERSLQIRGNLRTLVRSPLSGTSSSTNPSEAYPVRVLSIEEISVENGRFKRSGNPVAAAVDGEDVARLRECQRCQRIFWAYNINSRACSKPCANVLRQRNHYNQHYRKGR